MATAPQPQQQLVPAFGESNIGSLREDYGIQKIGFWLAVGTLVAIVSVTILLLLTMPKPVPVPQLTAGTTAEQMALMEKWAKLQADFSKAAVDRTVQVGQLFV